jgi:hypothetical protein
MTYPHNGQFNGVAPHNEYLVTAECRDSSVYISTERRGFESRMGNTSFLRTSNKPALQNIRVIPRVRMILSMGVPQNPDTRMTAAVRQ